MKEVTKYKLTKETVEHDGRILYRIKALTSFGNVSRGDLGGFVEKAENLSFEGDAWVYGDAEVYGNAFVYGDALVYGDARVYGNALVSFGHCKFDISKNLVGHIACSLNIFPINGKYYIYKKVNKIEESKYSSTYDKDFIYEDGKEVEVENPDMDITHSCSTGLHISTPFYWQDGDTLIAVEVAVEDVITCQSGKLRVKKLKVIGEVKEYAEVMK